MARAEYIEVEPHVRLHITDAGDGRPVVLIPGWPLSDEMYEYQYNVQDASSYATARCLIALRDTDLRKDLGKIAVPTVIMHGKKDKICSFDLAGQLKAGITGSHIIAFENSGHSLFLEETQKFNKELIRFAGQ